MADRVVMSVFTVMLAFTAVLAVVATVDYCGRVEFTTTTGETLAAVASAAFCVTTAIFSSWLALVTGSTAIRG
jgi:hypothetical protein